MDPEAGAASDEDDLREEVDAERRPRTFRVFDEDAARAREERSRRERTRVAAIRFAAREWHAAGPSPGTAARVASGHFSPTSLAFETTRSTASPVGATGRDLFRSSLSLMR